MAMVCPHCQCVLERGQRCPNCALRRGTLEPRDGGANRPSWQRTTWGRIIIGLIVSQGLYHGLLQASVAIALAMNLGNPREIWLTPAGVVYIQVLQVLALLVGGLLAGAGQNQGFFNGALLGLWYGVLLLVLQSDLAGALTFLAILGQPMLHGFVGGGAGFLGSRIWRPLYTPPASSLSRTRPLRDPRRGWFRGPLHPFRVMIGLVVAVAGALSAEFLFSLLVRTSEGRLVPSSRFQAQLITWEITALALLLGGALAGANTLNGFKQGFAVGVGAGVLLFGITLGLDPLGVTTAVLVGFAALCLASVGGSFGGRLLPPLVKVRRKVFD